MILKTLGFQWLTKVVCQWDLNDIDIPDEKESLVQSAKDEVDAVWNNYLMGLITDNERYNQVIDIWTRVNTQVDNTLMRRWKKIIKASTLSI